MAEVERGFTGDLIVQAEAAASARPAGSRRRWPTPSRQSTASRPSRRVGFTQAQVTYPDGGTATQFVQSVDPATLAEVFDARMAEGAVTDLTPGGALVDQGVADDNGLAIGDVVRFTGTGGADRGPADPGPHRRPDAAGLLVHRHRRLRRAWSSERQLVPGGRHRRRRRRPRCGPRRPGVGARRRAGRRGARPRRLRRQPHRPAHQLPHPRQRPAGAVGHHRHDRRSPTRCRCRSTSGPRARAAPGRGHDPVAAALGDPLGGGADLGARHRRRPRRSGWWSAGRSSRRSSRFGLTRFAVPVGRWSWSWRAAVLGVLASIRPARRAARLDILDAIAAE